MRDPGESLMQEAAGAVSCTSKNARVLSAGAGDVLTAERLKTVTLNGEQARERNGDVP